MTEEAIDCLTVTRIGPTPRRRLDCRPSLRLKSTEASKPASIPTFGRIDRTSYGDQGGGSPSQGNSPSVTFDAPNIQAAFCYERRQEPQSLQVSFDRQCCREIAVTDIAVYRARSAATGSEIR